MSDHVELRDGYYDSVSLLQVSRQAAATPGVRAAQVAMATDLNLEVIAGMGFAVPDQADPNRMVVAVRADDPAGVDAALAAVEEALLALRRAGSQAGGFGEAPPPRTTGTAVARQSASLALVSVPGAYAAIEALDALAHGANVMVFSDNVPVEDEIRLKDAAAAADLLVMGPDCGTALVGGVALGFANVVQPGPVGLVAASGTGAQQVMALLDAAGVGVSHCLGVGGRDLSSAVAARSTRQALAALDADPSTEAIVVVSKPPAPEVLDGLREEAQRLRTPVYWATLGPGGPDLSAATADLLAALGRPSSGWPSWGVGQSPARGDGAGAAYLRGLFCGGTLADEAMLVASPALGGIRSNIPLRPDLALGPDLHARDHLVIDFGDDALTRGRAHPMIDPTLRLERLAAEAADPTCGVLLLDLVLGHGAHPDPAPELAQAIRDARERAGRPLPVVVSLTATAGDPQGRERSAELLVEAGAEVYLSNAAATRAAVAMLRVDASGSSGSSDSGVTKLATEQEAPR